MKTVDMISAEKAKRRLRGWLLVFFLALSLPVFFLLGKVYSQFEDETYSHARQQAELLAEGILQGLSKVLLPEQNRSIVEYSFFNVLESPLLESTGIKFSPLSEIPPRSDVPGLVGFFQINPDNTFQIPALPELKNDNYAGLSREELQSRLVLKEKLRRLLLIRVEKDEQTAAVAARDEQQQIEDKRDNFPAKKQTDGIKADVAAPGYNQQSSPDSLLGGPVKSKPQLLSRQQLQELNIDAERWAQQRKQSVVVPSKQRLILPESSYRARKEIVKLPDQYSARSLFKIKKNQAETAAVISEAEGVADDSVATQAADVLKDRDAVNILSFESEVGPLQLRRLSDGYYGFYRHVWHNKNRYLQGFVVDGERFLEHIIKPVVDANAFSSIIIADQGMLIKHFTHPVEQQEMLVLRNALLPPFDGFELIINTTQLALSPGATVIDIAAVALLLIIIIGLLGFYRLGATQIELAMQQRNFISAVSHELKTPLTSIRMYAEMLRSGWVAEQAKQQSYYDFIFFESERLSRLISNVLQLARLENHRGKTVLSQVSADLLLRQIKNKVTAQITAADFTLHLQADPSAREPCMINVDEDAFFQIIINLVDNAIKFAGSAENKTIDIGYRLSDQNRQLVFFVRDYGPGIANRQKRKIFQLFYRSGDELTRTKPGAGIGLALVAQLAETMAATVAIRNQQPGLEVQLKFKLIA